MNVPQYDDKFPCFLRTEQNAFRNAYGSRRRIRISNRSFSDLVLQPEPQLQTKRRAMTEEEVGNVIKLTGAKPYIEEKFV